MTTWMTSYRSVVSMCKNKKLLKICGLRGHAFDKGIFYHDVLLSIFFMLFIIPCLLEVSINIGFLILNEQEQKL